MNAIDRERTGSAHRASIPADRLTGWIDAAARSAYITALAAVLVASDDARSEWPGGMSPAFVKRVEHGSGAATDDVPLAFASTAARTIAALPQACQDPRGFEGRTYFLLDSQRETGESIRIDIANQNKYGVFTGTFSRYSPFSGHPEARCQEAVRVPVEGYYDGYQLSLHIKQSATQPLCGDYDWRLTRRADGVFRVEGAKWRIELEAQCGD